MGDRTYALRFLGESLGLMPKSLVEAFMHVHDIPSEV
jgi:hypothetical protein